MAPAEHNRLDHGQDDDVILTPPVSLPTLQQQDREEAINTDHEHSPRSSSSSAIQRVFSFLKNVRLGTNLDNVQLPVQFNSPKSQLQFLAESVCCTNKDMLGECVRVSSTPLQRMISVVAWSFSTLRFLPFGMAPYNPVLGETHHLSRGDNLHVFLEQVSHHPPVTALHGTDDRNNIEFLWCHYHTSKFHGTSVQATIHGRREVHLKERGESYVMNSPNFVVRLLPFPGVDFVGNVEIHCRQTGLRAELHYKTCSFFSSFGIGRTGASVNSYVKGKIVDSSTGKTLCEIDGHWDRIVQAKYTTNGTTDIIYDAKETIGMLQTPTLVANVKVLRSESTKVWAEVSKAIMAGDWERAQKAKRSIEEQQRELAKQRKHKGESWVPKHFTLTHTKEDGWTCIPNNNQVLQSAIVFQSS